MALDTETPVMLLTLTDQETDIDLSSLQGSWTVEQYLTLSGQTNRLLEYTDGWIEILPMPTKYHQAISKFLFKALLTEVERIGGDVYYAPLRVQVQPRKFREPDLLMVIDKNDPRAQNEYWLGADLVMEIVSSDKPKRDTELKPLEYAAAGISEYWIVNPLDATITVLALQGTTYTSAGVFKRGQRTTSTLLAGFAVNVDGVFNTE